MATTGWMGVLDLTGGEREGGWVRTDCEEEGRAPVCALGCVENVVEEGDAWVHICEISRGHVSVL